MAVIGTAFVDIKPDMRRFADDVKSGMAGAEAPADRAGKSIGNKFVSGLGGLVSGVGKVIATGFTIAAGATTAFGAAVVSSGISYNVLTQRSTAAFKTILGSGEAATAMMDQLSAFAQTSPFPRQAFIEATQQMLAFGFAAEDVIPTLDAIQDAVAAAGGSATDINEIANVLSKVQSTGKFTAQTLNELGFRGIDAAKLIGQGMNMTADEVRSSITAGTLDAGQAMRTLTEQMKVNFGGAAANVKQTWVGATDRIKGAMRDIGSAIVQPFIGRGGGGLAVEWANKFADLLRAVEPLVGQLVSVFMDKLGPTIERITPFLQGLVDKVKDFGAGGKPAIEGVVGSFGGLMPVLAPAAGMLLKVGGSNIAGALGPLGPIVEKLTGPFGFLGTAIAGLAISTPGARDAIGQIIGVLGRLMPPIMDVVGALGEALGPVIDALAPIVVELVNVFADMLEVVGAGLADIIRELAPVFLQILNAVLPLVPPLAQLALIAVRILVPALVALSKVISFVADNIGPLAPLLVGLAAAMFGTKAITLATTGAIKAWELATKIAGVATKVWTGIQAAFNAVMSANPIILVVLAIAAIVAGIIIAYQKVGWFRDLVDAAGRAIAAAFTWIKDAAVAVFDWIVGNLPLIATILLGVFLGPIGLVVAGFLFFRDQMFAILGAVVGFFQSLGGRIVGAITALPGLVWGVITSAVSGMLNIVTDFLGRIVGWFIGLPGRIWDGLKNLGRMLWDLATTAQGMFFDQIRSIGERIVNYFRELPGNFLRGLGNIGSLLLGAGRALMEGFINAIRNGANAVWDFVRDIPGMILRTLGNLGSLLIDAGKAVIRGLKDGIVSMFDSIKDTLGGLKDKIFGWKGPLQDDRRLLVPAGEAIMEGLVQGFENRYGDVRDALSGFTSAIEAAGTVGGLDIGMNADSSSFIGPAVVIQNAEFNDEADVDVFMRRVAWIAETQMAT